MAEAFVAVSPDQAEVDKIDADCWVTGIKIFNKTLTKDDKKFIDLSKAIAFEAGDTCSLDDLCRATETAKAKCAQEAGTLRARLDQILVTIYEYSKAVDVIIQQQPDITAVVWGAMRFLIQAAVTEVDLGGRIAAALADIMQNINRWKQYLRLHPSSLAIQQSISSLYAHIINFLIRAESHMRKPRAVRIAKASFTPTYGKFAGILAAIERQAEVLEKQSAIEVHSGIAQDRKEHSCQRQLLTDEFFKQEAFREACSASQTLLHRTILESRHETSRLIADWQFDHRKVAAMDKLLGLTRAWANLIPVPSDIPEPEKETCKWILENSRYQTWMSEGSPTVLWIRGIPGCGKSVMANFLSRNKQFSNNSTSSIIFTYHFHLSDSKASAKPSFLAASVLDRILRHREVLEGRQFHDQLKALEPLCVEFGKADHCPFSKLWAIITNILMLLPNFTLIIDAMDECYAYGNSSEDISTLITSMKVLASQPNARVVILSRKIASLECMLKESEKIEMDAEVVTPDIELYLNSIIDREAKLQDVRCQILARAKKDGDGMFLWAKMMIESLRRATTKKKRLSRLQDFPEGLYAAYAKLMHDSESFLDEGDLQMRREMFLILAGATRFLTVDEVSEALTLVNVSQGLTEDDKDEIFDVEEEIKRLCEPFATLSKNYVCLVHLSVREFLLLPARKKDLSKHVTLPMTNDESNDYLARKCLSKLSLEENRMPNRIAALLRKGLYSEYKQIDKSLKIDIYTSFYEYAATNWFIHITAIENPEISLLRQAEIFLFGKEFVTWGEFFYNLRDDMAPIVEVRGRLQPWFSKLPPASQRIVHIDHYYTKPYKELSKFYGEDGGDNILPFLCLYRLGDFHIMAGEIQEAYEVKGIVADELTILLGPKNPLTLRAISTASLQHILEGHMREAEKVFSEISKTQLEVVGKNRPDGFVSLQFAAEAEYYMTSFQESAHNTAKANAGLLKILGPYHRLYLMGQLFYGYELAALGRLEQSLYILEEIYKERVKTLGQDNGLALMAQVAMGQVYRKLGEYKKAKENLEKALEARRRIWGPKIFISLDPAIHLIIVYREMGDPKNAKRHIDEISQPGLVDQYFGRLCQVEHLRALLLIDLGEFENPRRILQAVLDKSAEMGRESNNRALLWLRLTLATILREHNLANEALMLFDDIVTEVKESDSTSQNSLDEEPQPPRLLRIAEEALRLVRSGKSMQSDALLRENGLKWVRNKDFWIESGGPAADTAMMKGP